MWNDEHRGYDFEKQDLLEISVVDVPANAEALIAAGLQSDYDDLRSKSAMPQPLDYGVKLRQWLHNTETGIQVPVVADWKAFESMFDRATQHTAVDGVTQHETTSPTTLYCSSRMDSQRSLSIHFSPVFLLVKYHEVFSSQ